MVDPAASSTDPTLEFCYEPLDRNSQQIQLLEVTSCNLNEPLSLRLSIHDLEHKDIFNAISYTWGNGETTKDILINGKTKKVTENCHYALEQACRHFLPDNSTDGPIYFWIDSICIDQGNGSEKNHQVMLMGRIYAQASRVLACVGAHHDNSEELAEVLNSARSFSETSSFAFESPEDHHWKRENEFTDILIRHWWKRKHESTDIIIRDWYWAPEFRDRAWKLIHWGYKTNSTKPETFLRSYVHFVKRRYWTRLWIVPEVAASHRPDCELEVLCGWDKFSKPDIMFIHCIAESANSHPYSSPVGDLISTRNLFSSEKDELPFTFVMRRRLGKRIPVLDIFSDKFLFACSYPQDRVYGLLPLIEWPHDLKPVQPEYEQSTTFELTELLFSSSFNKVGKELAKFDILQRIVGAMEISHEIVEIQAKLVAQHVPSKYARNNYYMGHRPYAKIGINEKGQITANLVHEPWIRSRRTSLAISELGKEARALVQPLYVGSNIAAWLCNSARVGDLIVGFIGRSLLVLRNDSFLQQFIGQGLLNEDFEFEHSRKTWSQEDQVYYGIDRQKDAWSGSDQAYYGLDRGKYGGWCRCILELEPAEMLLLLGQDRNKDASYSTPKSVQRVFTQISGRASLKDDERGLNSMPNGELVPSSVSL